VLLLIAVAMGFAQMKPGDVRKAHGEPEASLIESVLAALYPGVQVKWDPHLTLEMPGEKPRLAEVPVVMRGNAATGSLEGVATVELDQKKERAIFEAKGFRRTDVPTLPTVLVVFRAEMSGHVFKKYKTFMLDSAEPLTEIKTMSIQDWSTTEWPTLAIQYDTHVMDRNSFTTIEWHAIFDANSGHFISRLPFGIRRTIRGGADQQYIFSIGRKNPSTLEIADRFGGATHQYDCSDPCVVDAHKLLSLWVH
jgi:hypothetical protein